jgi:ferritin-like metal-binding protein YciE
LRQIYVYLPAACPRKRGPYESLGEKASGETCEAMKGLVKEGEEFIKAKGQPDVRDAVLIGAA